MPPELQALVDKIVALILASTGPIDEDGSILELRDELAQEAAKAILVKVDVDGQGGCRLCRS